MYFDEDGDLAHEFYELEREREQHGVVERGTARHRVLAEAFDKRASNGHSRVRGEQEFTPLHRLSLLKALPEWRDTRRS